MKKLFVILLLVFTSSSFIIAQSAENKEVSSSKAVEFLKSNGTLIIKEFYDLPKVESVECQVLIIRDVVSNRDMGCLRLETKYYSSYSKSTDSYIGTLDFEEIDACIKSLNYIKNDLLTSVPATYTEVEYKTRDNLKLGAYYGDKGWKAFIYTQGHTSRSAEFLNSTSIDSLISVLNEAKQMIVGIVTQNQSK